MNAPPPFSEVEVLVRFLNRFADLMSIGSNAENLLRAAQLLEINSTRAREAERLLREECNKSATHLAFSRLLEAKLRCFRKRNRQPEIGNRAIACDIQRSHHRRGA